MNNLIKTATAISTVFSVFALGACNSSPGNGKETGDSGDVYIGKQSESSYSTAVEATRAFIDNELTSDVFQQFEINGAVKTADLSSKELAALKIDTTGATGASRYTVSYTIPDVNYTATHETVILEYGDSEFRYYSGEPKNGETITDSYMNYLTDTDKYVDTKITYRRHLESDDPNSSDSAGAVIIKDNIVYAYEFDLETNEKYYEEYLVENDGSLYASSCYWIDIYSGSKLDVPNIITHEYAITPYRTFDSFVAGYINKYLFGQLSSYQGFYVKTEKGIAVNDAFKKEMFLGQIDAGVITAEQISDFRCDLTVSRGRLTSCEYSPDLICDITRFTSSVSTHSDKITIPENIKASMADPDIKHEY